MTSKKELQFDIELLEKKVLELTRKNNHLKNTQRSAVNYCSQCGYEFTAEMKLAVPTTEDHFEKIIVEKKTGSKELFDRIKTIKDRMEKNSTFLFNYERETKTTFFFEPIEMGKFDYYPDSNEIRKYYDHYFRINNGHVNWSMSNDVVRTDTLQVKIKPKHYEFLDHCDTILDQFDDMIADMAEGE